jgi:hypothetical protein
MFARCDFGWPEYRTIGEFDGAEKYGRLLRPGEKPGDKIHREKIREEGIREPRMAGGAMDMGRTRRSRGTVSQDRSHAGTRQARRLRSSARLGSAAGACCGGAGPASRAPGTVAAAWSAIPS